jgi:CheY-like chemotaxis protein
MALVLAVDDTPDCLEPLAKLLRLSGHAVECASHGKMALEILERLEPDVVILDLMMPIMDGFGFLEAIREQPKWKQLRVIVLTGYGHWLDARRLAQLGVGEIFLKGSFEYGRLLTLLDSPPGAQSAS